MTLVYRGTNIANKIIATDVFPFDQQVEMYGYGGDDELEGAFLHLNRIWGGEGNDTLSGGAAQNYIYGENGNDYLTAWQGEYSEFFGGVGNDTMIGGRGGNLLNGGAGSDFMAGGDGGDVYIVDSIQDTTNEQYVPYFDNDPNPRDEVHSSVNWTLSLNIEDLRLIGGINTMGTGNSLGNTISSNEFNNILSGLDGNDSLLGADGNDTLLGGNGKDVLEGDSGNDLINGGGNIDTAIFIGNIITKVNLAQISAQNTGHGLDILVSIENITTASGADIIRGNVAANILISNAGNDQLFGAEGNDRLYGGDGNDKLQGDAGNDLLNGGVGVDTAVFTGSTATIVNLAFTSAQNTGHGMDSFASIENVSSGSGADVLWGNTVANTLTGNDGDDQLFGLNGNDSLYGGGDNDRLDGGFGSDRLNGGTGADRFIFNTGYGTDIIIGFQNDTDRLEIATGAESFAAITVTDSGANAVLTFSDVTITLLNVDHTLIGASDFIFV